MRDACCVAAKCVYKRRRASRLAFKSFLRGRRFLKLPPDFLLRCGRFDRLRWQLVFGTFLFGANTVRKDTNHQPPPLLLLPLPLGHQQEPHLSRHVLVNTITSNKSCQIEFECFLGSWQGSHENKLFTSRPDRAAVNHEVLGEPGFFF